MDKANYYNKMVSKSEKMTFNEQIQALERLHDLIKRKGTGTPEQLAEKFNVSVGTIKNLLKILKDKGFPIAYCRDRKTYYYERDIELIGFRALHLRGDYLTHCQHNFVSKP